ncbi:MAG TPA: mechanosensitive ion channel domain-containing protein [Acidocella sp.]|uniref:mechanosensitive ion channel family protein n=1 Tax=Acidocella sp. TaxID=50710 RepID=UPI002C7B2903|nr:mechanosensitive ion channel domain-containing protein [Acidocella sp.]HVE21550.1 mechanosensitive ion channel domain-containing protein [Acidocella sp.]
MAQTTTAAHPASHPAAPAHATPSAIIPGSPLAALTGAAAPPARSGTAAPPGTSAITLSISAAISKQSARLFGNFIMAVHQSTRIGPVLNWIHGFASVPARRAHLLEVVQALLLTILPGLAAERLLHFALARPRAALVRRAETRLPLPTDMARPSNDDKNSEESEEDGQGLADAEAGETEKRLDRKHSILIWGRRFALGLLHLGLRLVPLIGFAIIIQVLVSSSLIASEPGEFAVINVANAYLLCRAALELLRFVLAPQTPSLRLVRLGSAAAERVLRGARRPLLTGFAGFALVSLGELLGLDPFGATVLLRLITLVVHLEIAWGIWRSRRIVGGWISGAPHATSLSAGIRQRLGRIWHYPALFYVLALWIAWAGGVHNAFGVLLRVVLVVVAALIVGRLAWFGSAYTLERFLPSADAIAKRHALFARIYAYRPVLRGFIRAVIGILVFLLILQGWGIHAFSWLLNDPISRALIDAFIAVVITIAAALALWECANVFLNSRIEHLTATGHTRHATRLRTMLPIIRATLAIIIGLVAGLICLSKIGVNAAPLLAGAGVLGIAIGFGSQKLVQDVITGLFLLLEDAMQVGDVITLAGMSGTVERLSIRTIRLRGGDGSVNIIPFSAVTTVTNMTRDFSYAQISIGVGYEEDLPHVFAVLTDIGRSMRADPVWGTMMRDDLQVFGLDQFGASALTITGQIRTGPGQHWSVRREFYARVKQRFEAEGIELPYLYLAPAPDQPAHAEAAPSVPEKSPLKSR